MANKDDFEDDDIQDVDLAQPATKLATKVAGMNAIPKQSDDSDDEEDASEAPDAQQPSAQDILTKYASLKSGTRQVPQQNSLANILSTLNGGQDQKLQQAIADRDRTQLIANIGKGANIIAGGISRQTQNNAVYDEMLKNAGQGITDINTQNNLHMDQLKQADLGQKLITEQDKSNPDSAISKMSVQIAKQLMPNLSLEEGEASAADLEKLNPQLVSLANHRLAQQYKQMALVQQHDKHTDDQILKYNKAMGEDLDPNRARSGEMGKNQGRVNAADRINTLLQQFPDGNIPQIQTRELASSVASLLSNGSQIAIQQINELVPHTMAGSATKISEWVTDNPTGMQQQKFIKMYADTANREKATAQKQITQGQFKKAYSTHHKLKEMSPDDFYQNLSTATGLDPEEIQKMEAQPGFKGQFTAPTNDQSKTPSNEVERQTADGKIAIFDGNTKKFLRYK